MSPIRVFVSSSMQELAAERRAVKAALQQMIVDAWVFESDAGARPEPIRQTYLEEVERADLYLGIFWKRYGQYTIDEYRHASFGWPSYPSATASLIREIRSPVLFTITVLSTVLIREIRSHNLLSAIRSPSEKNKEQISKSWRSRHSSGSIPLSSPKFPLVPWIPAPSPLSPAPLSPLFTIPDPPEAMRRLQAPVMKQDAWLLSTRWLDDCFQFN